MDYRKLCFPHLLNLLNLLNLPALRDIPFRVANSLPAALVAMALAVASRILQHLPTLQFANVHSVASKVTLTKFVANVCVKEIHLTQTLPLLQTTLCRCSPLRSLLSTCFTSTRP